jgi:hypothetical protein
VSTPRTAPPPPQANLNKINYATTGWAITQRKSVLGQLELCYKPVPQLFPHSNNSCSTCCWCLHADTDIRDIYNFIKEIDGSEWPVECDQSIFQIYLYPNCLNFLHCSTVYIYTYHCRVTAAIQNRDSLLYSPQNGGEWLRAGQFSSAIRRGWASRLSREPQLVSRTCTTEHNAMFQSLTSRPS